MSFSSALSSLVHFSSLPEAVKGSLEKIAIPRVFRANQVIYLEGEAAEFVYLLAKGWVKAARLSRKGREQAVMVSRAVDLFGHIALFTSGYYPCTVTALEESHTWVFPSSKLIECIDRSPELLEAFTRDLAFRILHHLQLIEDLSLHSVEARLARTLVRYAENVDGKWIIPRRSWATYDAMAVRLGTVRDVLSRALKTLESKGLLRVEKQQIVLLEPQELAEYEG